MCAFNLLFRAFIIWITSGTAVWPEMPARCVAFFFFGGALAVLLDINFAPTENWLLWVCHCYVSFFLCQLHGHLPPMTAGRCSSLSPLVSGECERHHRSRIWCAELVSKCVTGEERMPSQFLHARYLSLVFLQAYSNTSSKTTFASIHMYIYCIYIYIIYIYIRAR